MHKALLGLALALGLPAVSTAQEPAAAASSGSFASARPAAFQSDRIEVSVTGKGPDVILIPGLSSSPGRPRPMPFPATATIWCR